MIPGHQAWQKYLQNFAELELYQFKQSTRGFLNGLAYNWQQALEEETCPEHRRVQQVCKHWAIQDIRTTAITVTPGPADQA